jgi:hypothetical protein
MPTHPKRVGLSGHFGVARSALSAAVVAVYESSREAMQLIAV